jgi:hypothetical protein
MIRPPLRTEHSTGCQLNGRSRRRRCEDTIEEPSMGRHHRHAALEAQQRHNVLLMLRALLAAYAVPPNCELLAALRLGAAGHPDVWVRPVKAASSAGCWHRLDHTTISFHDSNSFRKLCCNSFRTDGGLDAQNDEDHPTLRFYSNAAQLYKNVTRPPRCVTKVYNCGWLPTHVYKGLNLVPVAVHLAMAW